MNSIQVMCEICTFPLGWLDLDEATLPLKASMFKPLTPQHRAPFPDWRELNLEKDLELGDDHNWFFKCPQCGKVPFIKKDTVVDISGKRYKIDKQFGDKISKDKKNDGIHVIKQCKRRETGNADNIK